MRRPVGSAAEGGAGAVLVEVLIMAPASDPHRAGRIPRGDTVGMNRPGPLSSPRRMRRRERPGNLWRPERRPGRPAARDRTARVPAESSARPDLAPPPATGLPGPAIDATLSWRAVAARDWIARAAATVVRIATDLYDRADALREIVT